MNVRKGLKAVAVMWGIILFAVAFVLAVFTLLVNVLHVPNQFVGLITVILFFLGCMSVIVFSTFGSER
jgi:hypothetical protein